MIKYWKNDSKVYIIKVMAGDAARQFNREAGT